MGTHQITFLGLINFHDITPQGAQILLPNGMRYGGRIPDHFARVFLKNSQVRSWESDWWPPIPNETMRRVGVTVYPIPTWCNLVISVIDEGFTESSGGCECQCGCGCSKEKPERGGGLDADDFKYVPPLRGLEIVPEEADTITQLAIQQGKLVSYQIAKSEVATLTVGHPSDFIKIKINASPVDGTASKHLVLENGADIVLTNMSDLFRGDIAQDESSHFKIYSRLDRLRRSAGLQEPGDADKRLPLLFPNGSSHPFVEWVHNTFGNIPRPGCGITG